MKSESSQDQPPLRVAVVGTGYWGVNYLRLLGELREVGGVHAVDSDPDRLREVAERFPRVTTSAHIDDVIDEIDAAIVSTPAATHRDVAEPILDSGVHVLVEKPITTVSDDAIALQKVAEAREVTLAVGHTFLHHSAVAAVKGFVDDADFGTPYYMYSQRTNLGPIRRDVDALWDLAPHDISIFNHLLGCQPAVVSAVGHKALQTDRVDSGFITLTYPGEVIAHIHVSWADPAKVRQLVVVGSGRRIVFDDLNPIERVRVFEKGVASVPTETDSYGEHQLQIRDGDILSPRIESSEPLRNQVLDFFAAIRNGTTPLSDAETGLGVVRVMEAIERSVAMRGTPVLVEGNSVERDGDGVVVDLRQSSAVDVDLAHAAGSRG